MREYSLYFLYRAGFALLTALPLNALFRLGQVIGFCAWLILPHYRQLAFRNISIAFGEEKTPRELRRLVRRHFRRVAANILCGLKVAVIPIDEIERRAKIENIDAIDRH